jgi:hypothetical protein
MWNLSSVGEMDSAVLCTLKFVDGRVKVEPFQLVELHFLALFSPQLLDRGNIWIKFPE